MSKLVIKTTAAPQQELIQAWPHLANTKRYSASQPDSNWSLLQDFAAPREVIWLNGAPGSGKVSVVLLWYVHHDLHRNELAHRLLAWQGTKDSRVQM